MSGSQEHMQQTFVNVTVSATTQVYTETSAITTTTFLEELLYSTYGGKECEEYSNVITDKVSQPPITGLQVQGGAISAPAYLNTLCRGGLLLMQQEEEQSFYFT